MNAKDLIRAGKLEEARKQIVDEVRLAPADLAKRSLLFQILSFTGEWDKARRHLDAIAAQDSKAETGAQIYKNFLQAEEERSRVQTLKHRPSFLPEAPPYAEAYFAALDKLAAGEIDKAQQLFDLVDSERPAISGTLNGEPFTGFRDTDAFLSAFLEVMVHERYVWTPFESIRELSISRPSSLFDLLWIPARITAWSGLTMNCRLPVLYPESFKHGEDLVRLGRMTDWESLGGSFYRARGQHVFQIGEQETAILEIQEVLFEKND